MKSNWILLFLVLCLGKMAYAQDINTQKLDALFNSLEERNEAMGSITISREGKVLYNRAIGYRFVSSEVKIPADTATNYRIWSITKTYTATMILQLIEEGKLSLETNLDDFYPTIPHAESITIQDMLNHRSGIYDFANDSEGDWTAELEKPLNQQVMVRYLSKQKPNFESGTDFRYSNSNYLLLGYIIEELDDNLYEVSLANRISSKLGMTSTYFGVGALDSVENKAFSYQFDTDWRGFDEGGFSGLIPAGAGGIVSTTTDMAVFLEGLFAGRLVSKSSLDKMLEGDGFYGLGLMKMQSGEGEYFGHTGGYIASESSLFYYPESGLTIAYCTNGISYRKEDILNHVLAICHHQPFAVSFNRPLHAMLVFSIGLLFFLGFRLRLKSYLNTQNALLLGLVIFVLTWLGSFIAGYLHGDHNLIRDGITTLDSFYSNSGTFMTSVQLITALLSIPFVIALYKVCVDAKVSFLPILPILFIPISMLGVSLFPFPDSLYVLFANVILFIVFSPLLVLILWREKAFRSIRLGALMSLVLMVISMGLVLSRPSIPMFVHEYFGLLQRSFYLGWTLWLVVLGVFFGRFGN
ncbi:MAG: serine hydrolase [Chitinophagales bacterium]